MIEDSVTTIDYGVVGFPLTVIIGRDGTIVYVDFMSETPSDEQSEARAKLEKKMLDIMKHQFESVGETWPISERLDEKEKADLLQRVEQRFVTLQIESALAAKP